MFQLKMRTIKKKDTHAQVGTCSMETAVCVDHLVWIHGVPYMMHLIPGTHQSPYCHMPELSDPCKWN